MSVSQDDVRVRRGAAERDVFLGFRVRRRPAEHAVTCFSVSWFDVAQLNVTCFSTSGFDVAQLNVTYFSVSGFDVAQLNVPQEEFYSTKITNKVVQQIQDPLVLASNATPDWCEQLTMCCPMLFPFETRQLYFTCTAFGASRCVYQVHGVRDASALLHVHGVQRQQVRVSGSRRLGWSRSSMRLMAFNVCECVHD